VENKAVVSRFVTEVLANANVDVVDEVLAPDYVNVAMGDADRAAAKAMVTATHGVMKEQRYEDVELVAERAAVFARFKWSFTLPDGTESTFRTLAYYRLTNGKIALNDVMVDPDLMQVLGPLLQPPPDGQS
jgi:hypothetical protein